MIGLSDSDERRLRGLQPEQAYRERNVFQRIVRPRGVGGLEVQRKRLVDLIRVGSSSAFDVGTILPGAAPRPNQLTAAHDPGGNGSSDEEEREFPSAGKVTRTRATPPASSHPRRSWCFRSQGRTGNRYTSSCPGNSGSLSMTGHPNGLEPRPAGRFRNVHGPVPRIRKDLGPTRRRRPHWLTGRRRHLREIDCARLLDSPADHNRRVPRHSDRAGNGGAACTRSRTIPRVRTRRLIAYQSTPRASTPFQVVHENPPVSTELSSGPS